MKSGKTLSWTTKYLAKKLLVSDQRGANYNYNFLINVHLFRSNKSMEVQHPRIEFKMRSAKDKFPNRNRSTVEKSSKLKFWNKLDVSKKNFSQVRRIKIGSRQRVLIQSWDIELFIAPANSRYWSQFGLISSATCSSAIFVFVSQHVQQSSMTFYSERRRFSRSHQCINEIISTLALQPFFFYVKSS